MLMVASRAMGVSLLTAFFLRCVFFVVTSFFGGIVADGGRGRKEERTTMKKLLFLPGTTLPTNENLRVTIKTEILETSLWSFMS